MTEDALLIGLLILGMFLMVFSRKVQNILVALVTFTVWFALGLWLFLSASAPIGFGETWKDVLGWGFMVLSLLPWIFQMDVEIQHEAQGHRWTQYGQPPEEKGTPAYEAYRQQLFNRTRRRRRRP